MLRIRSFENVYKSATGLRMRLVNSFNFAKTKRSSGKNAPPLWEFQDLDKNNPYFKRLRQEFNLNDGSIFATFKEGSFLKYVNETQSLLPFLFDTSLLLKFRKECENNAGYQNRINNWYLKPLEKRLTDTKVDLQNYKSSLSVKKFSYLKPFYELYLEFLLLNHSEEVKISKDLSQLTDLRRPHEWYQEARTLKRKIIYHHGPTNSGKTFSALTELKEASSGIYCAPLRLLAWEIQERLLEQGVACSLITGQEKIYSANSTHTSCTIETANLSEKYDVAVIDEIQMIGDPQRGSAWTNALLGLQSKSIHLCGDERCLGLVEKICMLTGDQLIEKKYKRLSKLVFKPKPFNLKTDLKKGDCVITFSIKNVLALKKKINFLRGHLINKCAVIYGKLPPENRKDQARKFNDADSDLIYLIATNAIGMGLNLQIRRIIFHTLNKKGSKDTIDRIEDSEIRQIAGRAGRSSENGEVYCIKQEDVRHVKRALKGVNHTFEMDTHANVLTETRPLTEISGGNNNSEYPEKLGTDDEALISKSESEELISEDEEEQIGSSKLLGRELTFEECAVSQAGIFPTFQQLEKFSSDLKSVERKQSSLSSAFKKFVSIALIEGIYFIQSSNDFCEAADLIEGLGLELKDQFTFALAPIAHNPKWRREKKCFKEFAKNFTSYNCVRIPDFIDGKLGNNGNLKYDERNLALLEEDHHILDLYIWLGQKYELAFPDMKKAKEMKDKISFLISEILENI